MGQGAAGKEMEDAASVAGKVFDADGNEVPAQLLVWGPTDVDGELCMVARPVGFEVTEPNENYDGDRHAVNAADDIMVAVPMRLIQGDDRTEEEPGGPAVVGGYVRLSGAGDRLYRWIRPADVDRLLAAAQRVVDEEREGGASEEALEALRERVDSA